MESKAIILLQGHKARQPSVGQKWSHEAFGLRPLQAPGLL